jgi:DNA-binding transcriptional LysR family regulator
MGSKMQNPDSLSLLGVFVSVAGNASFSKAAMRLGMATSSVSRKVSELERRLGVQLLRRSTRRVELTEIGAVFFERCGRILSFAEEAALLARDLQSEPRGTLRVTAPSLFGTKRLGPVVSEYLARYPLVSLQMELSDQLENLAAGNFDVAIRITNHLDDALVARRLAVVNWAVCASPLYLSRHGTPAVPEDLRGHECCHYPRVVSEGCWVFSRNNETHSVQIDERIHINSSELIAHLTLQGNCIAMLPTYLVGDFIKNGQLVPLLPGYRPATSTCLYAMSMPNRYTTATVRCFIDLIQTRIVDPPPWDGF